MKFSIEKKQVNILVVLFILILSSLFPMAKETNAAGQFLTYSYNSKSYKVYVPSGYQSGTPIPVIMMLHGCTQDPNQFASGTKMNTIAERETFIVVYPDQPSSANQNKCWRWFLPDHQARGYGDPAHIAGITDQVKKNFSVDEERVFVAGLSAGAAMSVIMGAAYPDVFAAVGVSSGLEYKAATTETNAWSAMSSGGPDPVQQGTAAYKAMGSYARIVPTIVFHGTSDYTVYPINGHQVASQWAQTNDLASDGMDNNNIDDVADETIHGSVTGGRSYTKYKYNDSNGRTLVEKYIVDGMGHAWSGGDTTGSYTDPQGPDSSELMWNFFKNNPKKGVDSIAPQTAATPPGGTYGGAVTVELLANEPSTTYYTTDGSTPSTGSSKYSSPLVISSNTTLKFFSVDAAGNKEAIKTETYTFEGQSDITPPVTSATPAGGSYSGSVSVELAANELATTYFTTDGTTPTESSTVYNSKINITSDTVLKFFSVDQTGNKEAVKTETYDIITASKTLTLSSLASEDGFTGMYLADGLSTAASKVGDKGMSNRDTFRTILSFDTSLLQDDANISSAKLRVYRKSLSGSVSSLSVSLVKGYWATSSNLEQGDYNAAPSPAGSIDFATMPIPVADNEYSEINIPVSLLDMVNKTGRTQFRLKADTLADFASDILNLYGGETPEFAPQLIVSFN
ncbi:extracellular catalytic domain type 1 short-chain-length polyhydroxyalkanoate depolymerase [Mesobacillus jeotgali]|uniref:extracellular catalytic domain type 1 short-chain-length polyhydroxyalkanoate depolymerase n=1 Tax=Mesobacillus jeotgali TaxID=129985 RepID=UPI0009A66E0C|nr:PHB depolymerase family esterase [Mesobacillus jeotgali]